jgi:hypothetical protein
MHILACKNFVEQTASPRIAKYLVDQIKTTAEIGSAEQEHSGVWRWHIVNKKI